MLPDAELRQQVYALQALLFLSMLPLHVDKPRRQLAMLTTGLELYAQSWKSGVEWDDGTDNHGRLWFSLQGEGIPSAKVPHHGPRSHLDAIGHCCRCRPSLGSDLFLRVSTRRMEIGFARLPQTLGIAEAVVAKRSGVSRGQAETAFDALIHVDPSQPLWIYNIDTCVTPNAMRPQDLGVAAGCVPVFCSSEPNMSFVRYGSDGDVLEIAEKRPISSWATVGLYGFRSAACFAEHYEEAYDRERIPIVQGERYVAPIYALMLSRGERVVAPQLGMNDVHVLGTPAQILAFDPAAAPPFGS